MIGFTTYKPGDYVFYKRENDPDYKGPAKVIFQDSKIVWLRHGSYCCKVSVNRLQPVSDELARGYRAAEAPTAAEKPAVKVIKQEDLSESEDEHDNMQEYEVEDNNLNVGKSDISNTDAISSDGIVNNTDHNVIDADNDPEQGTSIESNETVTNTENHQVSDKNDLDQDYNDDDLFTDASDDEDADYDTDVEVEHDNEQEGTHQDPIRVGKHDRVELRDDSVTDGKWEKATITGRAGKAKTWPDCWNFKLDSGKEFWADIKQLDDLRKMPEEDALAVYTHEHILAVMIAKDKQNTDECIAAKNAELEKLKSFDTYEVVEDVGQKL